MKKTKGNSKSTKVMDFYKSVFRDGRRESDNKLPEVKTTKFKGGK